MLFWGALSSRWKPLLELEGSTLAVEAHDMLSLLKAEETVSRRLDKAVCNFVWNISVVDLRPSFSPVSTCWEAAWFSLSYCEGACKEKLVGIIPWMVVCLGSFSVSVFLFGSYRAWTCSWAPKWQFLLSLPFCLCFGGHVVKNFSYECLNYQWNIIRGKISSS